MDWYEDARFGLFIHWGAYSQLDGAYRGKTQKDPKGEWIMRNLRIPVEEYAETIAGTFNPVHFDAEEWVKTAYAAGIKYLVITTKHHDGFALFDSKVSDYNIVDRTEYGQDVIRELAAACARYGIRFGVYYSQAQDWYQPGGLAANKRWDAAQAGEWEQYFQSVAIPQVRELLDEYAPVSLIWFDSKRATVNMDMAEAFERDLRRDYPELILNPRLFEGDFRTFEQVIPGLLEDGYHELCITHNRSWSYKPSDTDWKSPEFLLRTYIAMVAKGGNFLFNVGPDPTGRFPAESTTALAYIGEWMATNGESIYGTAKHPFYKLDFGTATVKTAAGKTKLYLHVFDWPADRRLSVPGLHTAVERAYLLDGQAELRVRRNGEATVLEGLPSTPPHPVASVIVLEMADSLVVDPGYLRFTADSIVLSPRDALLTLKPQFDEIPTLAETAAGRTYLDQWKNRFPHPRFKNTGNQAHWRAIVPTAGLYDAWIEAATRNDQNVVSLKAAKSLKATLPDTGGMDDFARIYLGKVRLREGLQTITFTGGNKTETWDYVRVGALTLRLAE